MPIEFPKLSTTHLGFVTVCAVFPKDSPLGSTVDAGDVIVETRIGRGQSALYVRARSNRFSDGDFHLHINLATPAYFRQLDSDLPRARHKQHEVESHIQRFVGKKATGVAFIGRCAIDKESLPADGLAQSLLGIRAKIAGEELTLAGAEMEISGDIYDRIEWSMAGETVVSKLWATREDVKITGRLLSGITEKLEVGTKKFFLGI